MTECTPARIHTCRSIPATWRVAAAVAAQRPRGGVVALQGELGAGKTTFVQGLARALGIRRPITSPTFTLASEYCGDTLRLIHFDLYRLRSPDELLAMGFEDLLDEQALIAVEWPERAEGLLPADTVWVRIALTPQPRTRRIQVSVGSLRTRLSRTTPAGA